ncbi:MAG: beta-carotene 15,15'-monooxygenase, partial [Puniceicoccaceae bacterium MED-G30]
WFLFVPPLWAIGCYFALWHSLRHTLRILSTDTSGSQLLESSQYFKLNIRWLQLSSLMTLIALIGMWIIFALPFSLRGIELDWLAKALIGISVLTLPHTVVVCGMDRIQLRR